ncbi:MAG: nucleoside 2-deoxyribosyltransferase [Thermodesulfobacteriota bacterium]|nr:nucleoside 2-deoxyribosyltransferase [Thermodesulfobacteriota bacterium]
MNIYFAGAIRGGREDAELYATLIQFLKTCSTVLTEHVGNDALLDKELFLSEEEIFDRDIQWLEQADVLIAEVSTPSLGVGYELAVAEKLGIPCCCLFRKQQHRTLSAMIAGNPFFKVIVYEDSTEAVTRISTFLQQSSIIKSVPSQN